MTGISAAWIEAPSDSGSLVLFGSRRLYLPYSKTRAYFFMVSMGNTRPTAAPPPPMLDGA